MAAVVRRGLAALLVSAVWLLQASPAAALLGWSVSGSHTAVQAGGVTVATLRVSNDNLLSLLGIDDIGCIHVDVGSSFEIQSVSTAKSQWVTSHSGGRAVIHSTSGGARLGVGESVTFSITALAESAGSFGWAVRVIRDQDCGGSYITGAETFTVKVTPAPTPAPTPTPTPRPTPSPTPRPTPTPTPRPTPTATPAPTPLLPLPSLPLPSLQPLPGPSSPSPSASPSPRPVSTPAPGPEDGGPSPSPSASPTAAASTGETPNASPRPTSGSGEGGGTPGDGTGAPPSPGGGPTGGDGAPSGQGGAAPQVGVGPLTPDARIFPTDAETGELGLEISGIDLFGGPVWAVPAATIAGPGLLVLLWLLLQAIGAAAWMPSVRRLRGEEQSEAGSA